MKYILKEQAIALRKEGLTYSEILKQIPVAKSTLCEWLHSVNLAKHQNQLLTTKKIAALQRGGKAKYNQRIKSTREIFEKAKSQIGSLGRRDLWIIGIMLYWAEGSKQKDNNPSAAVRFTNMNPDMIYLFLKWLLEICEIENKDIIFDIYIHITHLHRVNEIIQFWSEGLNIPPARLNHVYFKKGSMKTGRKNTGDSYFGVMRIGVRSSTSLNRKIAGWVNGVVESFH